MAIATRPLQGTYVADPDHSSVGFTVTHMKVSSFRATFDEIKARFLGEESGGLLLEGRARVGSVSISNPPEFREHVINGADFFDAPNHPEIGFRSTSIEFDEDGTARVEGELEIKGVSRPVSAIGTYRPPVEDPFGSTRAALELAATVDRKDWGLDWQMPLPKGGDVLAYEVELTAHLELIKVG
jgi:polyisoprenoid-binding protein YceI